MAASDTQIDRTDHHRWSRSGSVVSDAVMTVMILTALIGVIAGNWYVAVLCGLVLVVTGVSRLWTRLALVDVDFHSEPSQERLMIGDTVDLILTVENRKPLPLPWLSVTEMIPADLVVLQEGPSLRRHFGFGMFEARDVTSLRPYERVRFRYRLWARRRGHYAFGPSRVASGDLFGFYEARLESPKRSPSVVVYPRIVPLPDFDLNSARPIGDGWVRTALVDDTTRPSGLREYRPGDPANRIDWKATARRGSVFVRTYDPSVTQRVVILLDCNVSGPGHWHDRSAVLEAAVTGAASIASRAVELGYAVGLVSNGNVAGGYADPVIEPGSGPNQLAAMLTTLAGAHHMTSRKIDELVAQYGAAALPAGATIVHVAAGFDEDTLRFLRDRKRHGHDVLAICVGDDDPSAIADFPIANYRTEFAAPGHA